mgnify:FL=1|jgi:hypothetical protein
MAGKLKERRKKRIEAGKWVLGEKLTKAGRKRAKVRRVGRKAARSVPKGTNVGIGVVGEKPKKVRGLTSKSRAKKLGAAKGTKVRKGAVGVKKTKGGDYVKYGKKTKAAKSFRETFKAKCAGGAESFTWDGRSYSCAKKGDTKKAGAKKTMTQKAEKAGLVKKVKAKPRGVRASLFPTREETAARRKKQGKRVY